MPRIIKPAVGSFTASNITIDSSGRVITASSGAGAANMQMVLFKQGPTSGTYTSGPNASKFQAYLGAGGGGGGGGGDGPSPQGQPGGSGGFGFYAGPVASGTSYSFAAGGAGNGGPGTPGFGGSGNAGGNSNITNLAVANAGAAGGGGSPNSSNNQSPASSGSAPGATHTDINRSVLFGVSGIGDAGNRGGNNTSGNGGGTGVIAIFDDRG
jgi:hypothetical protein